MGTYVLTHFFMKPFEYLTEALLLGIQKTDETVGLPVASFAIFMAANGCCLHR